DGAFDGDSAFDGAGARARARALLAAARALAGRAVDDIAPPAPDSARNKGGAGQRLEAALGLSPRFDDVDDPASGVELKTLPLRVDADGRPRVLEATFVTSATAADLVHETWATSRAHKKLRRVLFVPVERASGRVGTAFLYEPDAATTAVLRADWEDLADLVARGLGFACSSRRGTILHLRPKAKDASVVTHVDVVDEADAVLRPQGFYLRRSFTQALVDALFPSG
ncbi:MAG: DNA mismatch repair protein MutH, partial [Deltaproteobacteria bacterium]|nr:DNA mismatch repair protein MutH [Deltaproteobacteria bacterium]